MVPQTTTNSGFRPLSIDDLFHFVVQTLSLEAAVTPFEGLDWLGCSIWGQKSQEKLFLSLALASLSVPGAP